MVVEDAAQGLCATYGEQPLGAIGSLGAISFHETKNVTCGHGGVLVVNDERLCERAETLRDKGTDRSRFVRGQVDKYMWQDIGSSYAISDLAAAFLWPQLQDTAAITATRRDLWSRYHDAFAEAERAGLLRRPIVPPACRHNAHMYYLVMPDRAARDRMIGDLASADINAVFHYVPLHSSPAGRRLGRAHGNLDVTDDISGRLLRLPLWTGMEMAQIERVIDHVIQGLPRLLSGRSGVDRTPPAGAVNRAAPVNG
jgi:dTDP-4-amino-4,6-dideoxygalactose transaminase